MAKYIGRFAAPLALGAVVALGACKTDSSKQDTASALNRDTSALGRDLAMTNLKRSENANDPIVMEFAVNSVSFGGKTYALDASVDAPVTRVRNQPKSKDAQKVAIGAAAGAIAGQILGKNTKSTIIGGA